MTRKRTFAAIAILLMAMIATTSCEGGGGSGAVSDASAAVSAVRAMTQAVDAVGTDNSVTAAGDGYELKNFKADDGSVINGSFQTDAEGNIIDAKLTMEIKGRTLEFTLTTPSQGASPDVTVDDHDVPASAIPEAMTKEERLAFMMFLVGFDEVQDEIRDLAGGIWPHQVQVELSDLLQLLLRRFQNDKFSHVDRSPPAVFWIPPAYRQERHRGAPARLQMEPEPRSAPPARRC